MPVSCPSIRPPTPRIGTEWQKVPGAAGWRLKHFRTPADWTDWARDFSEGSIWMSASYLKFLHEHPQGMDSEAIALRHDDYDRPILLSVQSTGFRLADQVRASISGGEWTSRVWRRVLGQIPLRIKVIGQLLVSGPFGGTGLDALPPDQAVDVLEATGRYLMQTGSGFMGLVIKDLFPKDHPVTSGLEARGFAPLGVDPVMCLDLTAFASFSDYLGGLSSKYRVRYRRARKKLAGLERRRLSKEEVLTKLSLIHDLHRETAGGADFSLVEVSREYFVWLRERADFHGYFDGEELVGFTTGMVSGETYHAHFLGMREAYKFSHHLYHNMLFDLLKDALLARSVVLDYGRTALEIKSSLGARAEYWAVVARGRHGWMSRWVGPLTRLLHRPPNWEARSPFKGG
ncbi:acetyltransferase (GNAT) family protein [Neolewinella xylanilytica]|uniref:Acetyltransferase (GNAT) family protein n=1 Tax=Neolewinella xylanilytica TaxID=1514080 RepID=A0A2S6IB03_9BACT|nr:GNAT family N-acetyltransferase [Neolewinella xylanilytica]PPK88678.1 acetyltransferase (GNAT) family protein [Neolewinella xylanilytica]